MVGLNIHDKRVSNTTRVGNFPDGPTMSLSESPKKELRNNKENIEDTLKNKERLDEADLTSVLQNVINRKRFEYTFKDVFTFILKCAVCRKGGPQFKKHELF
jgi:hypothetical protein